MEKYGNNGKNYHKWKIMVKIPKNGKAWKIMVKGYKAKHCQNMEVITKIWYVVQNNKTIKTDV